MMTNAEMAKVSQVLDFLEDDELDAYLSKTREEDAAALALSRMTEIVAATAASDVARLGWLLVAGNTSEIIVRVELLPASVALRPRRCLLIDVAFGAGAAASVRCLLEFHGAIITRRTLKMANARVNSK
jgi:hypothetical protein